MSTYASIVDGVVWEIIYPAKWPEGEPGEGEEIPVTQRFTPEFVSGLVNIDEVYPAPGQGWIYDGQVFSKPLETDEDFQKVNEKSKSSLMSSARIVMVPVLLSIQLGNATAEETALAHKWQDYYRALESVDISDQVIDWPELPQ